MTARPLDAARDALIAVQAQLIVVLAERNSALEARVGELAGRLARLERAVSRNSGNSSMPPSADDLPGKTPPPRKSCGGGKRRQGKQPGAPGAHLAWSENPDTTVPLLPEGACACGRDLTGAADLGEARSHQVIDTPAVTATVTQYDEHAVECACGRLHTAAPPAGAGQAGTVTYGLNIQAWCAFLLAAHHVPVERCAEIIAALTGTRPSDGFVHAMLARAARAVRSVNMLIRALVITAAVLCADETPLRVGPGPKTRKKYLLVACTNLLTYYFLGDRSMKPSRRSCSRTCPAPCSCTTRTRITTRSPAWPTSYAASTSCVILRMRPSHTRTRPGPARPRTRSAPCGPGGCCWNATATATPTYCAS